MKDSLGGSVHIVDIDQRFFFLGHLGLLTVLTHAGSILGVLAYSRPLHSTLSQRPALHYALMSIMYAL